MSVTTTTRRPLFRPTAVERHTRAKDLAVLPWFLAPRTLACCWLVLGMVVAGLVAAWTVHLPVYARGSGIVLADRGRSDGEDRATVLVVLPREDATALRPGGPVLLHLDGLSEPEPGAVIMVDPEERSPTAIRQRFGLDAGAAAAINRPGVVVLVRLAWSSTGRDAGAWSGSVGQASIQVGTVRVASLLSVIGRVIGE